MILGLISISGICFAQKVSDKIEYIAFKFSHSRISNSNLEIRLIKRPSEIAVLVNSMPMERNKRWDCSIIDTCFYIDRSRFDELAIEVLELTKLDLYMAFEMAGLDGILCSIEFGGYGNTLTYSFWSPDSRTEFRGLSTFVELCKKLILIGGLKPEEIL